MARKDWSDILACDIVIALIMAIILGLVLRLLGAMAVVPASAKRGQCVARLARAAR